MDKKYVKKIISVLLGIALISIVFSLFSLIFDAAFADDLILLNDTGSTELELDEIITLMKWMTVSLVCVLVPTIVCYFFAYFGNGKIFNIVSAVLSLLITATCIAFICVLRQKALDTESATIYAAATGCFDEFIQLAATSFLLCAFFVCNSVFSFLKKPESQQQVENTEVQSNEEV